ncbi:hypothetical protein F2Q68_00002418 [Brassica cretica]|uniref:Uncharacterized protein n=1 Tax=Brassica cretica TaxID=69181 RepID=A0A8S9J7U6_BRACR|nr:hypothetical protein F2Q68_00002418 [Brassica cretica]
MARLLCRQYRRNTESSEATKRERKERDWSADHEASVVLEDAKLEATKRERKERDRSADHEASVVLEDAKLGKAPRHGGVSTRKAEGFWLLPSAHIFYSENGLNFLAIDNKKFLTIKSVRNPNAPTDF